MLQTFNLLYQVIFKGYLKNPSFHLQQNVQWTNERTHMISASTGRCNWGMFGPLYLLNKHGDFNLLRLMQFFRTHIYKEHLKKVSRRLLHKYFFKGITLMKLMSFTTKTLNAFFFSFNLFTQNKSCQLVNYLAKKSKGYYSLQAKCFCYSLKGTQ